MTTPYRLFRSSGAALFEAAKSPTTLTAATPKPKKAAAKPKVARAKPATPGRPNGILKQVPVSSALGNFLGGAPEASRTDAVKKVWEHIKLNNLQNPANKKEIICDDKLKTIFEGKDRVGFLEIAKLLSPHFAKAN